MIFSVPSIVLSQIYMLIYVPLWLVTALGFFPCDVAEDFGFDVGLDSGLEDPVCIKHWWFRVATFRELTYPRFKGIFEDDFPFPVWWDMLIPWRVNRPILAPTIHCYRWCVSKTCRSSTAPLLKLQFQPKIEGEIRQLRPSMLNGCRLGDFGKVKLLVELTTRSYGFNVFGLMFT